LHAANKSKTMKRSNSARKLEEHDEIALWSEFDPAAWENSIQADDGFFQSLYTDTVWYVDRLLNEYKLTTFFEIGCGTGQIIERAAQADRVSTRVGMEHRKFVGIDINPKFIEHCKKQTKYDVEYFVADATRLVEWQNQNYDELYDERMLVACVNNTLSIMPPEIRPAVVRQMRKVAGQNGLVFLTYWNGRKFREGLVHYYKKNPSLCGNFDIAKQDFERRKLLTETGYTSYWPYENEVELMVISYGVRPADIIDIKVVGKGVFVIIKGISREHEDRKRAEFESQITKLSEVLSRYGLEQYAESLVAEGFDDMEMWTDVTHDMLKEVGMKAGHRLKWDKMIRSPTFKTSSEEQTS